MRWREVTKTPALACLRQGQHDRDYTVVCVSGGIAVQPTDSAAPLETCEEERTWYRDADGDGPIITIRLPQGSSMTPRTDALFSLMARKASKVPEFLWFTSWAAPGHAVDVRMSSTSPVSRSTVRATP